MTPRLAIAALALAALLGGCGGHHGSGSNDAGNPDHTDPLLDAGDGDRHEGGDEAGARDGALDAAGDGAGGDGAQQDGAPQDGAQQDGAPQDGAPQDAAQQDAAQQDAAQQDAAQQDAAQQDAAQQDAAQEDAAQQDAAQQDAGGGGEVWFEIDYTSAYTPSSPDWTFSNTPGWGPAQWAMQGDTWPEAWDRFNNMTVSQSEPIGPALIIGPSAELQVMLGFEELVAYTGATVRLEGRSYSTSASVLIDVYNPWNGCGITEYAQMSNDWTVHVVELDFDSCFEVGQGVQAVRVVPSGGSDAIALVRLRVTLHGATW